MGLYFKVSTDPKYKRKKIIDNNGGDRPTQLLSTCFSQLRVWLERVCLFFKVAVVAGLNAIFA